MLKFHPFLTQSLKAVRLPAQISVRNKSAEKSSEFEFNPNYENKNPRNLEWTGHQNKRFGWNLQFPPRDFYHQLTFKVHDKNLEALVDHASGRRIITLTSKDPIVRQYLHSSRDLSAATNLGRIVAQRCLQFGIDQIKYLKDITAIYSEKEACFREALKKGGLKLQEPEYIETADETLGLDYDRVDFHQDRRDVPFPPKINKFIQSKMGGETVSKK